MNSRPRTFIDFHVHLFPDEVAPKAISRFRDVYNMEPLSDGTLADTSRFMREAGVSVIVPMPVATRPQQVENINNWMVTIRSESVVPFGAMHPEYPDIKTEMDRLVQMGFPGIKLQPDWQEFYPDEERVFPIYEAAEGRLAILFHAGQEVQDVETVYSTAERLRRVRDRFPDLTMIIAHMGGYKRWDEAERSLAGTGVYFDMSYCPEDQVPDDEFVRLLRSYGTDRVVFASDFPFADPRRDIERLLRVPLTPEEKEAIAWRTAAGLLGV